MHIVLRHARMWLKANEITVPSTMMKLGTLEQPVTAGSHCPLILVSVLSLIIDGKTND